MSDQFTHPHEGQERFKCCNCQQILYGMDEVELHCVPDVNGLVHTVVPITKCIFCHGCDSA